MKNIKTTSKMTYSCSSKKLYKLFIDFENYPRFVPYSISNKTLVSGKNWKLKDMFFRMGNKKKFTKSFVLFDQSNQSFKGIQVEGPYPGMEWHLQIFSKSSRKCTVISSHQVPLMKKNQSIKNVTAIKKKLKNIEKNLLVSVNKYIMIGANQ